MQMHLREPSNESKHSYKLSEILFKSHQGTINDMGTEVYKSIRFSDDQMPINFMNGQMNIYSQINEKDKNQEQESSEDDNYNEPVYETTESYTTSNGRKTELNDDLCISNGESSPTKKYSTSGLNYDEYHKSAISHPNSQEDAKFSITQEQREGLMKRIMFLKMQKEQENQEFQEEEI